MSRRSENKLFFYAVIGFFAGIYIFFKGFKKLKLKRMVENMPTSKIRSIAIGMVEVAGKAVEKKNILKSPMTNSDCVYYKALIEKLVRSGKSSKWVKVKEFNSNERFFVKDDTGMILVDPNGAEIDIPFDYQKTGMSVPKELIGLTGSNFGFGYRLRFTEWYIAPKDQIYVLGYAGKNPEKSFSKVAHENIMIQKVPHEKIYYISDAHEENVVKKLKKDVILYLYGGPLLSILCLLIILLFLNGMERYIPGLVLIIFGGWFVSLGILGKGMAPGINVKKAKLLKAVFIVIGVLLFLFGLVTFR